MDTEDVDTPDLMDTEDVETPEVAVNRKPLYLMVLLGSTVAIALAAATWFFAPSGKTSELSDNGLVTSETVIEPTISFSEILTRLDENQVEIVDSLKKLETKTRLSDSITVDIEDELHKLNELVSQRTNLIGPDSALRAHLTVITQELSASIEQLTLEKEESESTKSSPVEFYLKSRIAANSIVSVLLNKAFADSRLLSSEIEAILMTASGEQDANAAELTIDDLGRLNNNTSDYLADAKIYTSSLQAIVNKSN